jgi:SNF2 family DNA or RNA helicase
MGGMSMRRRAEALEDFKTNDDVPVFLLNKQCGAVGLNLTVATHVLIVEPSWNPVWEDQAVSRAHRLGQTGPIEIRRYCLKGARVSALPCTA